MILLPQVLLLKFQYDWWTKCDAFFYDWWTKNGSDWHHIMAGLATISPNGTWLGIEWFNKTSSSLFSGGWDGRSAEGFSITSLTTDSSNKLYAAINFGKNSYGSNYASGGWTNNESITIGGESVIPWFDIDGSNYSHIMAGLGEIAPNGTWIDIQWFNKTSPKFGGGHDGYAVEGFSITSLTTDSSDKLYVAVDFGGDSYLTSNGMGGRWKLDETFEIGNATIIPFSANLSASPTEWHHTMAGWGEFSANGNWLDFHWFNKTSGCDCASGNAAEGFSISALEIDHTDNLYVAINFGKGYSDDGNVGDWHISQYFNFLNGSYNSNYTHRPVMTPGQATPWRGKQCYCSPIFVIV